MAIQLIHVSDIHFGSGESHGTINPTTGLNVRFEDFARAFATTVDYAISHNIDVFLFSGDAYKNASPGPLYQKAFAEQLKRLSAAQIATILLVGNHDQILKSQASHSMSVFQSLEIPGVVTIDKPRLLTINTKNGALQVIGIPHVTSHILMTAQEYADLPSAAIDKLIVKHVHDILSDLYSQLDSDVPAVATAHMMLDSARAGAEQELMIGYSLSFPMDIFLDERLDYVALGHVHRYQILRNEKPTIAYAGSLERVDFGEEGEDKGFLHVELSRGAAKHEFHSIEPRPFVTVQVDLCGANEPQEKLLKVAKKKCQPGCVMRVHYKISQDQQGLIDEESIRQHLKDALTVRFKPELVQSERRLRLPQINEEAVATPLAALETYLAQMAPDRKDVLLDRARKLSDRLNQNTN